uniref:Uncharacterized protein n=1 Tax=Bionectria ochroleuca TaxID=29856 RepID=A0A8H7NFC3_BIOOC
MSRGIVQRPLDVRHVAVVVYQNDRLPLCSIHSHVEPLVECRIPIDSNILLEFFLCWPPLSTLCLRLLRFDTMPLISNRWDKDTVLQLIDILLQCAIAVTMECVGVEMLKQLVYQFLLTGLLVGCMRLDDILKSLHPGPDFWPSL